MTTFSIAICTYNRAQNLPFLIAALRTQTCPAPFEIVIVDNNSNDSTANIVENLIGQAGISIRYIHEPTQGITFARNRAIKECLGSDYLAFIDDDEEPHPGWLEASYHALHDEGATCVGGRIEVAISKNERPTWLTDELLGFLGQLDYGDEPFWVAGSGTPVWSGNIAYRMSLFRDDPTLRFDARYNRVGAGLGGGEDAMMFRVLLTRGAKIRYRPDMAVRHFVEPWRLERRYFLKLHYRAGLRHGLYQLPDYPNKLLGVPPFLLNQLMRQSIKCLTMLLKGNAGHLRQSMNIAHTLGTMFGYAKRSSVTHHE